MEKFQSEIIENKPLTEDVHHLVLIAPENFNFIPGQYISIILDKEGRKLRRPYSISNIPGNKNIELCIKIIPNGLFTPTISNFKKGDKLEMIGPLGDFTIKNKDKDLIFISAGTGIGPFRSMIPHLLKDNFNKNITLIAGYRKNKLYDNEFKELEKKHNNFTYLTAISSEGKRVTDLLSINKQADYYVCGLLEMINSVRAKLIREGVKMKNIISEKYD